MSTPFLLSFLWLTPCLPFMLRYAFCEKQTRLFWQSRMNSALIKPFRPDTSEPAYQRFRLQTRLGTVIFALIWTGMALRALWVVMRS